MFNILTSRLLPLDSLPSAQSQHRLSSARCCSSFCLVSVWKCSILLSWACLADCCMHCKWSYLFLPRSLSLLLGISSWNCHRFIYAQLKSCSQLPFLPLSSYRFFSSILVFFQLHELKTYSDYCQAIYVNYLASSLWQRESNIWNWLSQTRKGVADSLWLSADWLCICAFKWS